LVAAARGDPKPKAGSSTSNAVSKTKAGSKPTGVSKAKAGPTTNAVTKPMSDFFKAKSGSRST
jgi:hypothetical protein